MQTPSPLDRSFRQRLWQYRVRLIGLMFLLLVGLMCAAGFYVANLPTFAADQQQTIVVGPSRFAPESPAALRVLVRDTASGKPVANASVAVKLQPKAGGAAQTLYTGQTDARGVAPVAFKVPAATSVEQTLIVETQSSAGRDRVERPVLIQRSYKALVTSDKPLYQPGQTMHLRALALSALDRAPAKNESIEFLVEDPKGNKVFRKSLAASAFGVASAEFTLADTVISGDYKITASIGDTQSQKTVTVKPYVLPKFKVSVQTERPYYTPGERVVGQVRADYFFGKPVARSDVKLTGAVYDVQRVEMVSLKGQTNADGVYLFEFRLPDYFAGRGLDKNRADFAIEITVNDQANHSEDASLVVPIASAPILIDAVAESGTLVRGLENIVYILTTTPDGAPLEADVTVSGAGTAIQSRTGKYGLAEIRLTPQERVTQLLVTARDAQGRTASRSFVMPQETTAAQILLRTDHAAYRVGETMRLELLTTGGVGTVYLDLVKEGQTILAQAVDSANNRATAAIDVTAEMIGTVQLHAYHVELNGTITRDTRLIVVEPPDELRVSAKAEQDTYRPGDTARVTFNVTNRAGKGVASALGVNVVDEAVFALAEQDAGFAKLYFLLQKELLEPKYQVKGFELPEVISPETPDTLRTAQDQSARAAWAGAPAGSFALQANSQIEKREAIRREQSDGFNNLAGALAALLMILPVTLLVLVGASLWQKKILLKSIGGAILAVIGSAAFLYLLVRALTQGYYAYNIILALLMLGTPIVWFICLIIVLVYTVRAGDNRLKVAMGAFIAYVALLILFVPIATQTRNISEGTIVPLLIALLVVPIAYLLLASGLWQQQHRGMSAATALFGVLFIFTGIATTGMMTFGGAGAPTAIPAANGVLRQEARPLPAPTTVPASAQPKDSGAQAEPRLRQHFPETLYTNPQLITDESGQASVEIPLADSITTWRMSITASSQRGELGVGRGALRVFQDFFVDLDLPVALTQNDEIAVPVAVYNYLPQAQKVRLVVERQGWFTLQDDAEKTLTIASNDIEVVYFRIKAMQFGAQALKVTAYGDKMSDAIQRSVRVHPDGKPIELTKSNWLKGDTTAAVPIPEQAVAGASRIEVKIYPGIMSQMVDGLDNVFRMPFG